MTYAESQNKPPFDWNAELQKKIGWKLGFQKGVPASKLKAMACEWVTCATGGQCDAIPRHKENGAPKDAILHGLGMNFYHDISACEWRAAQATLAKIEARSAEILATL